MLDTEGGFFDKYLMLPSNHNMLLMDIKIISKARQDSSAGIEDVFLACAKGETSNNMTYYYSTQYWDEIKLKKSLSLMGLDSFFIKGERSVFL